MALCSDSVVVDRIDLDFVAVAVRNCRQTDLDFVDRHRIDLGSVDRQRIDWSFAVVRRHQIDWDFVQSRRIDLEIVVRIRRHQIDWEIDAEIQSQFVGPLH